MKRICLSMLFLLVFGIGYTVAEEIWVIEDEGLVYYVKEENHPIYPIPPEGVPIEIAGKLIRGEISDYVIEGDGEIKWALKPFWYLREIKIIPQTKVSYSASAWISEEIPPQKKEETDWTGIILFLIMPALCILMVSITNQNAELGDKKLFIFYGMFFILIIFCVLISYLVEVDIGLFIGMLVGTFVGAFAGWFAGWFAGKIQGAIIGLFAGTLVGAFAGVFTNDITIIGQYLIFIALTCLLSLIAAKAIKKRWPVLNANSLFD